MQIAILGGSFNPVHNGHLQLARFILQSGIISEIWLLPSAWHPLKKSPHLLSFSKRLELLQKAIANIEHCFAFDYDDQGEKPSYTAVLLRELNRRFPDNLFHFIIGYDLLAEIHLWHDYPWLCQNAHFIIINRRGNYDLDQSLKLAHYQMLQMPPVDISSTLIRQNITAGKSITGLVPSHLEEELIALYSRLCSNDCG